MLLQTGRCTPPPPPFGRFCLLDEDVIHVSLVCIRTNLRGPVYVAIKVKLLMPSLMPPVVQECQVDGFEVPTAV